MTITEPDAAEPRGFRPGSRRRARIAGGVALAAVAVGGNVLVYSSLDDSTEVVQFVSNIDAGTRIGAADVRIVELDGDLATANLVPADQLGLIVNQYARTYIPSGSLASVFVVQSDPLVSPGTAVVAVDPEGGRLPSGIQERSRVLLVDADSGSAPSVEARVVAVPADEGALSVEVAASDAVTLAAADAVVVVLLEPGADPATSEGG